MPSGSAVLPVGLMFGLGAALMWGLTDVNASLAGRRLGSLRVLALSQLVGVAILTTLAVLLGASLPRDPHIAAASIAVGLVGSAAYLSFFTALRIGPLSVVSPITAAYGGLTVVLAVVFTGESLTSAQAAGAALATAGVVLAGLVFDHGWRNPRIVGRGVAFAIVALVMFALMTVGSAGPIRAAGWLPVILLSRITQISIAAALLAIGRGLRPRWMAPLFSAPEPVVRRAYGIAALAGLLDAIGLVSFSIGLSRAETWLVGLASSFGPAVAVVVAVALLGERLRPTQWIGLAGIAAGLVAVAVG